MNGLIWHVSIFMISLFYCKNASILIVSYILYVTSRDQYRGPHTIQTISVGNLPDASIWWSWVDTLDSLWQRTCYTL